MRLLNLSGVAKRLGISLNEFDKLLKKAQNKGVKKVLAVWNRGLGDIPLGLYALIERVNAFIPGAEITFLTRVDLLEAFSLLEKVRAIGVPWWERGKPFDVQDTLTRLRIPKDAFDLILERINPSKWFPWQIGYLTPRLNWKGEFDDLYKRFELDSSFFYIGAHISTETQQFYGYRKDWPRERWGELFNILGKDDIRVILFGINKDGFGKDNPSIIDLRGETGLIEMLSIIKNCCKALIAPDGGILSIVYYLDVSFPITVVSLWSDPRQGVLKQAVPSPNPGLLHIPLIGRNNDVSSIGVNEVLEALNSGMKRRYV